MLKKQYVETLVEYVIGAPVESANIELYQKLIDNVSENISDSNKIIKKFKRPHDLLNYVQDNLVNKPSEKMLALYESTIADIMTTQTETCFKSATTTAGKSMLVYTALGLLTDKAKDVFNIDTLNDISKIASEA